MKRSFAVILAFMMMLTSFPVLADQPATASGVVRSGNILQITAPFSGVLTPFDWNYGDTVAAGDVLFEMMTQKVYAPSDGVMQAVFVEEGDLCEDSLLLYGSVGTMTRENAQFITADTKDAYDDDGTPVVHAGEAVYIRQSNDEDNKGKGRIIAAEGASYTVELTSGLFDDGEKVDIFSDENMGTKTKLGTGIVTRQPDLPINASGRVLKVYVQQGEKVTKGQLLFETVSPDADPAITSAQITAPVGGALEISYLVPGQQVYKGQLLCTVHDLSQPEVVVRVDEVDLDKIALGDSLNLVFDRYPDKTVTGVVTEISSLGVAQQNAVYYDVVLTFSAGFDVVPGMNVTLWLDGQE
ncbi:MAG: HlyD family efflux transporter periplasmic adaptor subunit [Clostridiales bacterium]|nr:HlyD family efflux transporter periplasmic adaptor subunit [Clostridiales bacterium]